MAFAWFNYEPANKATEAEQNSITQNMQMPFQWSPITGLALIIGAIVVIAPGKRVKQ